LLDLLALMWAGNVTPDPVAIMAPRTLATVSKFKEATTNAPLARPAVLTGNEFLITPTCRSTKCRAACSAPLESSHLSDFVRPESARAPIAQCLVWALFVVPADPRGQLTPRVVEAGEVVLPDTFFLQAAEEALDDAVLLWRVGRDELLGEPVVATRCPKPP